MPQIFRFFQFFCLFSLLSVSATAQTRDGRTWNILTPKEKFVYVAGFFDGNTYASLTLIEVAGKRQSGGKVADLPPATLELIKAIDDKIGNMSPQQLIAGIDRTYDDYRNQRISMVEALFAVIMGIKGIAESDVNWYLEQARKTTALRE